MPNIRVAIVEDDVPQAELLSDFLSRFAQEKGFQLTTERFSSAVEMAETYKGQFDILFLDIMMPGQTGMELAHEIRKNDPKTAIIFVTSLSQFAIEGYEVEALDYILKPLIYGEFRIKMLRAFSKMKLDSEPVIRFEGQNGIFIIPVSNILYCETSGHSVIYHTSSGDFRKRIAMKQAENDLPAADFLRINSCYLVARKEIQGLENRFVILKNGERLLVSRPRLSSVMEYLRHSTL